MNNRVVINSLEELDLRKKFNRQGKSSVMYVWPANLLFKNFLPKYQSKGLARNRYYIEMLYQIMNFSNVDYLIKPITLYENKEEFYGYTILKSNSDSLYRIDNRVLINDLAFNIDKIKKTIYSLSMEGLNLLDMHPNNILYGDCFYLIDIEHSLLVTEYSREKLYLVNMERFYNQIINALTLDLDYDILHDYNYTNFLEELKKKDSDDYRSYLLFLKDMLENRFDKSIVTVKDMKRALNKCKGI